MVQSDYPAQTGHILYHGSPKKHFKDIEAATNMYPGRLVMKGTYESDAVVCDAIGSPMGWLGHEGNRLAYMKDSRDTILTIDEECVVYGSGIYAIRAKLAAYFTAIKGDYAVPWSSGRVAPAVNLPAALGGGLAIRFPYEKKASEFDTGVDLVAGQLVTLPQVLPVTADASGTIDIGLLYSENSNGGDADGFVDGLTIPTAATWGIHDLGNTTNTATTIGDYLDEHQITDATADTPYYVNLIQVPGYQVGASQKSVSYTTSNYTQTGFFFIPLANPGNMIVGRFPETVAISSSDQNAVVENMIS